MPKTDECYYGDPGVCSGDLWTCRTCGNRYCETHNHVTSKGENVECVACERERKDEAELRRDDPVKRAGTKAAVAADRIGRLVPPTGHAPPKQGGNR
jgi:hypothetical protein